MNWFNFLVMVGIGSFVLGIAEVFHMAIQNDLGEINPRYRVVITYVLFIVALLAWSLASGLSK